MGVARFDVVVVGAGTAGAYAAYLLARAGLRVALLESKRGEQLGVKVCGDGLGKHHVDRLSRRLTPNPAVFSNVIRGVELFGPRGSRLVVPGEGYVLDRFEWGRWLIREAVNAGAELMEGTVAKAPIIEDGRVVGVVAVDSATGSKLELRASVTLDASGSAAVIRTRLPREWPVSEPLDRSDVEHAYREVVEVDSEVENHEYIKIYLSQEVAPGGYWWIFPRSRTVINVGLGVWGLSGANPSRNYYAMVRPRVAVRGVIHMGGGFIPTRRPLHSLVAPGFAALGDAAAAVNPIHGGGIGQALLTAELAADTVVEALGRGDVSERGLWGFNVAYMREWGWRQAQLDALRLALLTFSDEDLEYGLSGRVLSEEEIYEIAARGFRLGLGDKLKLMARALARPHIALRLAEAAMAAQRLGELYKRYPEDPSGLARWAAEVDEAYSAYRRRMLGA